MLDLSLYVITDRHLSLGRTNIEVVAKALEGGASVIQLREKDIPDREFYLEGLKIKPLVRSYGKLFLVNDRVDITQALDADGVHLGQEDLPISVARRLLGKGKIIGISVRSVEEAKRAVSEGADYLAVSGVFPTETKKDVGETLGVEGVRRIREAVNIPLVGIGGINSHNAAEVIRAGADGVAVVSAVTMAPDVVRACRELLEAVQRARREG
ncbi:MAG: thiamine phosphate synthase [Candidatus Aminicenantes bacterium]|nr:thiamine phosphate synthase [Candidatus Aminicenantes bacterium]